MSENLNLDRNVSNNIKDESKKNESLKATHRSEGESNKTLMEDFNSNTRDEESATSAPVEILSEFLSSFMSRDYRSALHYCKLILQYEPDNEIVRDFYPLLMEKIETSSEDSEGSSTKSESSTEYFSSAFGGMENNSCFSRFLQQIAVTSEVK